ncbi:UNKNOWN [Stylonychia lemnae]|uniref:Uncharacterized protein n=1 Tax=Stylonychia lemnae TaxID=5949 RepID=A0A078AF97_STYLE|nr:UNKNOWN [Stylonychia lemnae]|eukprot:CDW80202.1 UNKNOWN [Stylonychia lemnae]
MNKSKLFLISPSQLISQSTIQDSSLINGSNFNDYDRSEDGDSIIEQKLKVNQTSNQSQSLIAENNQNGEKDDNQKLPQLTMSQTYAKPSIEVDFIDPMKYRYSDDKPFPLKLLNSNHIFEALEFLKYDYSKYNRKIYVYLFWIYYCKKLREKLKTKYMKLFILTQPPKDDLFEVFPFILGKAIYLTIEKHLKNGKLILNGDDIEQDLFQQVHQEVNGFTMSKIYLTKNLRKYLHPQTPQGYNTHRQSTNLALQMGDGLPIQPNSGRRIPMNHQTSGLALDQINSKKPFSKRTTLNPQDSSKELNAFKNQLKKILLNPQQDKRKNPIRDSQASQNKGEQKNSPSRNKTNSWQWFGSTTLNSNNDQYSMMSMTSRYNKFETNKLSPMFTSFYSTNSFTNPLPNKNITLKKHITQQDDRPESNFEILLRAYKNEKIEEIEEMKRNNNLHLLSKGNLRAFKNIAGKELQARNTTEVVVKRKQRKWVIGEQISSDGNIMTSPGLQKLIELKHAVDRLPTNFNFEKKILRSSVPKRIIQDIGSQYSEIADKLLPEYRDILLQAQRENQMIQETQAKMADGISTDINENVQRKLMQDKYEKKMRMILKRKNERDLRRQVELQKEQIQKEKELQKVNLDPLENYQAIIPSPYIKEQDVEFWFENIFQEYTDDNNKKKQNINYKPEKNKKYDPKQASISMNSDGKTNPFGNKRNHHYHDDSMKSKVERSFNEFFQRQELKFNGGETPRELKVPIPDSSRSQNYSIAQEDNKNQDDEQNELLSMSDMQNEKEVISQYEQNEDIQE